MEEYVRGELLGKGSYGAAYLVTSRTDGKKYVVKEISLQGLTKKETDTAIQEAKLLLALRHPNIVSCAEAFQQGNFLHIILEHCAEGDLAEAISKRQSRFLPEEIILDWFVELCLGLAHIHDRKIVHRDIKPQNIFISSDGILKIGDFGVSRILSSTAAFASTLLGTPYYLSPEICANKSYNQKTDVWSLGCVLYEMIGLRKPFLAPSQEVLSSKIKMGQYVPLPAVYSKELKALVASMLSVNPSRRPGVRQILNTPLIRGRIDRIPSEIAAAVPRQRPPQSQKPSAQQRRSTTAAGPTLQAAQNAEGADLQQQQANRQRAAAAGQREVARLRLLEEHRALEQEHRRIELEHNAVLERKRLLAAAQAAEACAAQLQAKRAADELAQEEKLAEAAAEKEKVKRELRERARLAIKRQKAEWAVKRKQALPNRQQGAIVGPIVYVPARPARTRDFPSPKLQPHHWPPRSAPNSRRASLPDGAPAKTRRGSIDGAAGVALPSKNREIHDPDGKSHAGLSHAPREQHPPAKNDPQCAAARLQAYKEAQEAAARNKRAFLEQEGRLHELAGPTQKAPDPHVEAAVAALNRQVSWQSQQAELQQISTSACLTRHTETVLNDSSGHTFGQAFSASGIYTLPDGHEVDIGVDWNEPLDVRIRAIRRALRRRMAPEVFSRVYEHLKGLQGQMARAGSRPAQSQAADRSGCNLRPSEAAFIPLMHQLLIGEALLRIS